MTRHLTYSSILRLVKGDADPAAAAESFGHLAYCAECTARARAVREIRADFDATWEAAFAPPTSAGSGWQIELAAHFDPLRRAARILVEQLGDLSEAGTRVRPIPIPSGVGSDTPSPGVIRAELRIESPTLGHATVVADAERRSISVLLVPPEGVSSERFLAEFAPRIELRATPSDEPRIEPFAAVEGANYLLAEAIDLRHVSWSVTISSDQAAKDRPTP